MITVVEFRLSAATCEDARPCNFHCLANSVRFAVLDGRLPKCLGRHPRHGHKVEEKSRINRHFPVQNAGLGFLQRFLQTYLDPATHRASLLFGVGMDGKRLRCIHGPVNVQQGNPFRFLLQPHAPILPAVVF